ncbi:hypothetical protein GTO89_11515 [Heliobacterium gestii]|uniref:Uncharacterized protein n=1 Tax=Heliomicrobium gestii TaxID=2699 RepID=A0A845LGF5_HELGE|nr:hypothetical protein [Heliomicrobium gestii]MBM7867405.1 hypothetical protein [Heliomicrobium gestii]MZP43669.1 hypothetical protein [Heliomicrobium gestii]
MIIRRSLKISDEIAVLPVDAFEHMTAQDRTRVKRMAKTFFAQHNPYVRHIVRRTRKYLEETIDPETREPYLKPVGIELYGERDEDAIVLPTYLNDAYQNAEELKAEAFGNRMELNGNPSGH